MAARRRNIFIASLAGAAIFAAAALGAAKPLTPQPGETVRSATLRGVTMKRYRYLHSLDVVVRLTANVQRPLVRVRLLRGRKIVWKASERAYGSMSEVVLSSFTWQRPRRLKQGTRLKLVASISSGGVGRGLVRVVRAP